MGIRYAEGMNIFPVLGPVDTAATPVATQYVDLDLANWLTFIVNFGNMTSDDSDSVLLTVECSTAGSSNATEQAIPFSYRLSSAVGTNGWGTITAGTSDGAGSSDNGFEASTGDNKSIVVDVDPAAVAAKATDMRWVRLVITPTGPITIVSAQAYVETRYPGNAIPSSS